MSQGLVIPPSGELLAFLGQRKRRDLFPVSPIWRAIFSRKWVRHALMSLKLVSSFSARRGRFAQAGYVSFGLSFIFSEEYV